MKYHTQTGRKMRSSFHSLHLQMQNTQVCHRNHEQEEVQHLESSLWEEHYKQNLTASAEPKKRKNEEDKQRLNRLTVQNATHKT
jgi:hypothetical protein